MDNRRESESGYHYWSTYHDCPWMFYMKYVLGWRGKYKSKALIKGSAMHEAMASFYKSGKVDDLMKSYLDTLEGSIAEFQNKEDMNELIEWGPKELMVWYNGFGHKDMEEYEVLSIEEELKPKLSNGMELTMRPDRILKKRSNNFIVIRETKTTGYSIEASYNGVKCEDQATAYVWAVQRLHPEWKCDCVEVDVIYRRQSSIRCDRPAPIYRSKYDLAQFELGVMGTFIEISQKAQSLDKFPPQMLFPRHGRTCSKWGCDYEKVCRLKPTKEVPPGFVLDERIDFSKFNFGNFDIERLRDG